MKNLREAELLERFRREHVGGTCSFCVPPGGIWSDKDEGKPVGRVYIGKTLLRGLENSPKALLGLLSDLTGLSVKEPELVSFKSRRTRGLFVDATYTLGDRVWLFEIKTSLKRKEALSVGAQLWLYRQLYKWENPDKKVAAWIITTRFVDDHPLIRKVFFELYVDKLSLVLVFLDEGRTMGPRDYFL